MKKLFTILALGAALAAQAGSVNYNFYGKNVGVYDCSQYMTGATKSDTYDAAVFVNDPDMVGHSITGVSLPMVAPSATDAKVWLSSKLNLAKGESGKKENVADIMEVEATVTDGVLRVDFEEPYTIPAEGVYVGYTFTVKDFYPEEEDMLLNFRDKNPVSVYYLSSVDAREKNGFWLHNRTKLLGWMDLAEESNAVLAMDVWIDGFPARELAVNSVSRHFVKPGEAVAHTLGVSNRGSEPISSIGYEYEIEGQKETAELEFEEPLPPMYRRDASIEIPAPGLSEYATYFGELKITSLNGEEYDGEPVETQILVYDQSPARVPFGEEYTGMWCGYCPQGIASMDYMNDKHPDEFIAVAIHNKDVLATIAPEDYPSEHVGYPDLLFNRQKASQWHPNQWFGLSPDELEAAWNLNKELLAIGEIAVTAQWDEAKQNIKADATFSFIIDERHAHYKVCYLLSEDGMSSEDWYQENYLNGQDYYRDPYGYTDKYVDGGDVLKGVVYNDVLIYTPNILGEPGSVPEAFQAGQKMTHSVSMAADKALNLDKQPVLQDKGKLSVVALLLDGDGYVVNCAKAPVLEAGSVGVEDVAQGQAEAVYYDLTGRRVARPAHGVYVKVQGDKAMKVKL